MNVAAQGVVEWVRRHSELIVREFVAIWSGSEVPQSVSMPDWQGLLIDLHVVGVKARVPDL